MRTAWIGTEEQPTSDDEHVVEVHRVHIEHATMALLDSLEARPQPNPFVSVTLTRRDGQRLRYDVPGVHGG